MPSIRVETLDGLKALSGQELAVTDWFEMTQERINRFAGRH